MARRRPCTACAMTRDDLGEVVEIVRDPRREVLRERHDAELRVPAAPRKIRIAETKLVQPLQASRPQAREGREQLRRASSPSTPRTSPRGRRPGTRRRPRAAGCARSAAPSPCARRGSRWPTTSNGLHVSGPSVAAIQGSGRPLEERLERARRAPQHRDRLVEPIRDGSDAAHEPAEPAPRIWPRWCFMCST